MGDFFGPADPSINRFAGQVVQAGMLISTRQVTAVQTRPQHGCIHRSGQNGVDADIIPGKLDGSSARQCQQAALAGGIRRDIRRSLDGMDRGDIDNRPTAGYF